MQQSRVKPFLLGQKSTNPSVLPRVVPKLSHQAQAFSCITSTTESKLTF